MKKIISILLLSLPFFVSAQKVKFDSKTKEVTIDGVHSFNIDRTGCGFGMVDCHFDVFDSSGNKVFRVNFREFNSPRERSASNPEGRVTYYEFVFLSSKTKAEVETMGISQEKVAKYIVKNNFFKDGHLDEKAVEEFVLVHGTPYAGAVKY